MLSDDGTYGIFQFEEAAGEMGEGLGRRKHALGLSARGPDDQRSDQIDVTGTNALGLDLADGGIEIPNRVGIDWPVVGVTGGDGEAGRCLC